MKWSLEIGTLIMALLSVYKQVIFRTNKNNENNMLFLFDRPIEILAFFYLDFSSNI